MGNRQRGEAGSAVSAAEALDALVAAGGPLPTVGIGVVAPYDFALDRELWRWLPKSAHLMLTRTPLAELEVSLAQAAVVSDLEMVTRCAAELITPVPSAIAYACTSGSFVSGREGERQLVAAMASVGVPAAVTTSGALVEALAHLGVRRLAVATPYDAEITLRLEDYLAETGTRITAAAHLGLTERIWTVPYATTVELVRSIAAEPCDAVFISCTNLPTYDIIAPLERELGVPILTANQVTLWAALRAAGLRAVGPGQALLSQRRQPSRRGRSAGAGPRRSRRSVMNEGAHVGP
ncbi:MAG: maleate cis-trans isomerase family protein [Propionibacteriaceae bacterium]